VNKREIDVLVAFEFPEGNTDASLHFDQKYSRGALGTKESMWFRPRPACNHVAAGNNRKA